MFVELINFLLLFGIKHELMNVLLRCFKMGLFLISILLIGYVLGIYLFHDTTFYLNEKYNLYVVFQVLHIVLSLTALFVVWSRDLFDKWGKIDQTLIILLLSVFGLWIWYIKYQGIYRNNIDQNDKIEEE